MRRINAKDDPESWYQARFECEPDYSDLLEKLAVFPAERTAALARYFEGAEGEEELRQPTNAHIAIAKRVKRGYIRVIITTNFDRLMERALETEGVSPTILATPDGIQGAPPLAHSRCTLIKVHGDYQISKGSDTCPVQGHIFEICAAQIESVLRLPVGVLPCRSRAGAK